MRHLAGDVRLFKILCTRCGRTPVLHLTATWQTSHGVEWVGACRCGAHASVTTDGELAVWPTEEDLAAVESVSTETLVSTPWTDMVNVKVGGWEVGHVITRDGASVAYLWEDDGDREYFSGTFDACVAALSER